MQLIDYLSPDSIRVQLKASSKKRVLEIVSETAAQQLANPALVAPILDGLLTREKLGSTGIGHGVAIPHCRLADITEPLVVLLQLQKGIDYNNLDQQPVDIIIALLVPEKAIDEHLQLLACIAEQCSDEATLRQFRETKDAATLLQIMATFQHD